MMNTVDYDRALYYMYKSEWDNLLILMVRTNDDLLSKKIEQFLHAFHFRHTFEKIEEKTESLFEYLDHAMNAVPINVSSITG